MKRLDYYFRTGLGPGLEVEEALPWFVSRRVPKVGGPNRICHLVGKYLRFLLEGTAFRA